MTLSLCKRCALLALIALASMAEPPAQPLAGFPFQDETLRFRANWPTGVSLGEGRMQARRIEGGRWDFELTLDASIPGITITDSYHSATTAELCSVEFKRDSVHGPRKSRETVTFAQDKQTAHRATTGLGPLGDNRKQGFLLQSALAVLPATGTVLGLAASEVFPRVPAPRRGEPQRRRRSDVRDRAVAPSIY